MLTVFEKLKQLFNKSLILMLANSLQLHLWLRRTSNCFGRKILRKLKIATVNVESQSR